MLDSLVHQYKLFNSLVEYIRSIVAFDFLQNSI